MADNSSSAVSALAIVAIVLLVLVGGYYFLNHMNSKPSLEINVPNPASVVK